MSAIRELHKSFISFPKRAEKSTSEIIVNTFVDTEPLLELLSSKNSQIMYGRRGTGKTHALKYLAEKIDREQNQKALYIDLRSVGSDGALYHDVSKPASERSIRLILDVLSALADELFSLAIERIDEAPHGDQITIRVDELYQSITDVRIIGNAAEEDVLAINENQSRGLALGVQAGTVSSALSACVENKNQASTTRHSTQTRIGEKRNHIEFGRVQGALKSLIGVLDNPTIWILIDEWSEIPIELQPYLADLVRKTLLPLETIVVKIASIEHRSRFSQPRDGGGYLGMELGADISADLSLDDFLVFDNDQAKSIHFFKNLLHRHYLSVAGDDAHILTADDLVKEAFTQSPVFDEFVRAVEGVPRDALNLAAKIATKAYGRPVSVNDVRSCARDWYQQDKAAVVRGSDILSKLLNYIIEEVIGKRRARAFMLPSDHRDESVERLFDARIFHLLKRNISSNDEPGRRFDAFKIDYGCYVDLINTVKAPLGLFEADDGYVEVPADDYRSIRRAILTPEALINIAKSCSEPDTH